MGRAPPYAVGGRLSRGAPVGRDRRRRRSEFGGSSEYRRRGVGETPVMTANDELPPVPAAGRSINRRQALAGLGSLGIAALLAACGKDSKPDRAAASTTPTNTSADVVALPLGSSRAVTSQLFFDEAVTRAVYAAGPYAGHTGQDTTNANDGIFAKANLLTPVKHGDGYLAAVNLDVKTA